MSFLTLGFLGECMTGNQTYTLTTLALIQTHMGRLQHAVLCLPELERSVDEGLLGNCENARLEIRLHKKAIQQLAATL